MWGDGGEDGYLGMNGTSVLEMDADEQLARSWGWSSWRRLEELGVLEAEEEGLRGLGPSSRGGAWEVSAWK